MNKFPALVLSLSAALLLAACGDDGSTSGSEATSISDKNISGVSQKGPFVNGSSVTVYGLDGETLAQTGNIYEGKIRSDMGEFSVKVVKLASQYALLKANGFYRNEVTGEKSNSPMTLYALTDLSDRDEVNVNLLTHLAYERSLYLAADSMSVASAKKQAEAEVFKSFEIEGDFDAAEDLNIFGENDQSAALLAISVLMQGDLKEADFSERLDNYARDIEADGIWDDKNTATEIADWASEKSLSGGLATIRANVEKWGQLFGVPPFEKYVDNFWWQSYELKTCDKNRQGEVKASNNAASAKNGIYFICDNNAWRLATDIEKDTATWGAGKFDEEIRAGQVNKNTYYIYEEEKKAWRVANDIDRNVATWGAGKFDGEIRAGQVNKDSYYIYETSKKAWRIATTIEKDTFGWKKENDGVAKKGNVTDTIYVFENGLIRLANARESLLLEGCTNHNEGSINTKSDTSDYVCKGGQWVLYKGTLVDERDNQVYSTVRIGKQIWMAQDLNYVDSTRTENLKGASWCWAEKKECSSRLYFWNAAMDISSAYQTSVYGNAPVRGICPEKWHLPSSEEWQKLIDIAGGPYESWFNLKNWGDEPSTDSFGFDAAWNEGGYLGEASSVDLCQENIDNPWCQNEDNIIFFGTGGSFYWSSTGNDEDNASVMHIYAYKGDSIDGEFVHLISNKKTSAYSVRCVKDEE